MKRVYQLAAITTLFAVFIPVFTFAIPFAFLGPRYLNFFAIAVFPAALIPLFITPPIAFIVLNLFRVQTLTIEKVDEYVRFDALTGVLTRAYLLGKAREILPKGGAFLMVDADHFKAVNDTYGHDVGDEALKRIAEVLRKALSTDALIGRLGGEEFGVFLPGADDAAAAKAAQDLCETMRTEGRTIAGQQLNLTISIGGALHQTSQTLEKTMKLADTALYQAKRTGRDRYFIAGATDTMPALILKTSMAK
ncbi:GGDEF domain-containing protein [Hoeflea sp. BAL378]|uniref:GGDEF domain-containing protein n=1 Tax=Hoeflea sp. BAL378 TaxID=1547437 RepID=UPI00068AD903|nr:GGDEF domain-containing protein [Hoeflea sp. BAL378]